MKLTVCFKTIPDYGMVPAAQWHKPEEGLGISGGVRQVFNCYEESALEMALSLGESRRSIAPNVTDSGLKGPKQPALVPFPVERTALTVDDARADLFLRHLSAAGYDRAVRISPKTGLDFSPGAVATLIAAGVTQWETPDLVIFGPRGGAGEHCQTGPLVAEMLGWPCLMSVADLEGDGTGTLQVTCRTDRSCRIHTAVPPLVLVTGIAADTRYLRIPTLKQKLAARKKKVQVISPLDLGLSGCDLEDPGPLPELEKAPRSGRTCTLIHGDSPREKAQVLAGQYLAPGQIP
jgi:electron transfer flavoprotein alpha/beta subunit